MKRSKFYQFFPPPQFLQMPAVGFDISDTSMRFVELIEKRKGFVVGRYGELPIPRGVIESGEVKKPAELRAIFSDLKKIHNLEFASVSLPEERAYLFEMRLPSMKYSDVRGAIELELEEHIPVKTSEALFDYDIIKEDGSFIDVSVTAVESSLIDGYMDAFSGSGITPVSFEVEAQSVARAVVPEGDTSTAMLVDFGRTRTGVAIVSEGVVKFTSTIPIGGGMLTDAIAKNMNVSYEEAEKIKHENGISVDSTNEDVLLATIYIVSTLREEIGKHKTYWQEHNDEYGNKRPVIEKIYLCGGDSNLSGFLNYLSSGSSASVELANVMINVNTLENYVPEISFNDSLRYATAFGLALRRSQ